MPDSFFSPGWGKDRGTTINGTTSSSSTVASPTESSFSTASNEQRKKHVEVCVRIRPLVIGKESSNSFFHARQQQLNSMNNKPPTATSVSSPSRSTTPPRSQQFRKPQIPRPGTSSRKNTINNCASPEETVKSSPPPVKKEDDTVYAWSVVSTDTVRQSVDLIPGRTHTYTLDHVYGPEVPTRRVYEQSVQGLVRAAMEGYHTAVLAYGQTSTGKTFTMTGTKDNPGLIPLSIQECFTYVKRGNGSGSSSSGGGGAREYLLRVSYLEVYKEHIRDLLVPTSAAATPVRLFDAGGGDGLVIKGLREEVVTSPQQVFELLEAGESRRQVGATHMNQHSSRSHVMLRIWVESRAAGGTGSAADAVRVSSLSLVDLAGSESVRLTGSNDRRSEGHYINKSLMTLGQVVYALSESNDDDENSMKKKHIPYRDSKLTRLLQPSLSGNAQVVLMCCISPIVAHIEESHNTFKFASRAKKIPQKATIQETADEKTMLQAYLEEIEDLKQQLKDAREQQERYMKMIAANGNKKGPLHSSNSGLSLASTASSSDYVSEGEVQELMEAIETMEKLILKSNTPARPEDLIDVSDDPLEDDDDDDLMALVTASKPMTPARPFVPHVVATPVTDKNLHNELSRIQGLLGSVLKRRMTGSTEEEKIRSLRAQLEEQQVATFLRKADSSFLQAQLEEKDKLLSEVSKLLEAVEERQSQLESENNSLRNEVARLKRQLRDSGSLLLSI